MGLRGFANQIDPLLTERLFRFWLPQRQKRLALGRVRKALSASQISVEGLRATLVSIADRPEPNAIKKGEVSPLGFQSSVARGVLTRVDDGTVGQSSQLSDIVGALRLIAASNVNDEGAFVTFIQSLALQNAETLADIARYVNERVAIHICCRSRLDRARDSILSFANSTELFSHIIVIGDESLPPDTFAFDSTSGILSIPCGDWYECLPEKVAAAFTLLAFVPKITSVLKLDDDHRLKDIGKLGKATRLGDAVAPIQIGNIFLASNMFAQNRCWHIGKAHSNGINSTPRTSPLPTLWASGESGYLLNRASLEVLLFASCYAADFIRHSLYEDLLVSELLQNFGGRIIQWPTDNGIGTVDTY